MTQGVPVCSPLRSLVRYGNTRMSEMRDVLKRVKLTYVLRGGYECESRSGMARPNRQKKGVSPEFNRQHQQPPHSDFNDAALHFISFAFVKSVRHVTQGPAR